MTLQRLEVTPLTSTISEILIERKTGALSVVTTGARKELYWSLGELVLANSSDPEDSLKRFLERRNLLSDRRAESLIVSDPTMIVPKFDELDLPAQAEPNQLLRDWTRSIAVSLFCLEEGTTVFIENEALEPEKRVFLSTASVVLDGIRGISSGLLLRACLGDLKREIALEPEAQYTVENLPLTSEERAIAASLTVRQTIDSFLRSSLGESVLAARVTIAMLTFGVYSLVEASAAADIFDESGTDLAVLASIGGDRNALAVYALSKQLEQIDHYQLLDVPRAATRAQIIMHAEQMSDKYDVSRFPAPVHAAVRQVSQRIDEAMKILADADKRTAYDKALQSRVVAQGTTVQQSLARRSLARENFRKAEELYVREDFYGAIVLLKQAVKFAPDHAKSWHLLGVCQEKNPRWKRQAIDSFQRALSLDPNSTDTMLALGDLYSSHNMATRARTFYEDVLKVDHDSAVAKSRLKKLAGK